MYTYKVEQAIKAASLLHHDQLRKGDVPLPYVTHLVSVALMLRDYTSDEDTLVAALLHDTLEDTDYTEEELKNDFGETVHRYVLTLTEPSRKSNPTLSWLDVKKTYAQQLRRGPAEAVMIAAADKAHNFRSTVDEYFNDYERFLKDFGPKLEERIEAYQTIANAINSRLPGGIVHEFNHTFDQYKQFIFNVKKTIDQNYQA